RRSFLLFCTSARSNADDWTSMCTSEFFSRSVTLLSFVLLSSYAGCGRSGSRTSGGDNNYVAESIQLFEAETALDPGTRGLDQSSREEGLLFRINVLKTMRREATAAAPALEKLRDATQNPEIKQAATEALAEIRE